MVRGSEHPRQRLRLLSHASVTAHAVPFFAHLANGISAHLEHSCDALLRNALSQCPRDQCPRDGGFFFRREAAALPARSASDGRGREGCAATLGQAAAPCRAAAVGAELDHLFFVAAVRAGQP